MTLYQRVIPSGVVVPPDRPEPDPAIVNQLAESIDRVGLLNPITIWRPGSRGVPVLVAGRHRLAAVLKLRWSEVPCIVLDGDEGDPASAVRVEMAELSENLHRREISQLDRDVMVARWIELADAREVSVQAGPKPKGGRPEGGVSKAARDLGIPETSAKRAVKVASLSPAAKEAARETGLDDNRSALLAAAKEGTPEAQVAAIRNKSAVRELRDSLPTAGEAKRIAKETGALVVGRDGKFHSGATAEESARGEAYLEFVGALRTLRDIARRSEPTALAALVSPNSADLFDPLLNETIDALRYVDFAWAASRRAASALLVQPTDVPSNVVSLADRLEQVPAIPDLEAEAERTLHDAGEDDDQFDPSSVKQRAQILAGAIGDAVRYPICGKDFWTVYSQDPLASTYLGHAKSLVRILSDVIGADLNTERKRRP